MLALPGVSLSEPADLQMATRTLDSSALHNLVLSELELQETWWNPCLLLDRTVIVINSMFDILLDAAGTVSARAHGFLLTKSFGEAPFLNRLELMI